MRILLSLLMILIIFTVVFSQEIVPVIKVKYLSAEYVYIDGGTTQGLAVGDKLIVRNDSRIIANLEVAFVSENSASCKILKQEGPVNPGDMVVVYEKNGHEEKPQETEKQPEVQPEPTPQRIYKPRMRKSGTQISGSISAQIYHYDDQSEMNLDFTQPTMRLNLRAQNLWGKNYNFRVRTRARYNRRSRSYSNAPKDEWRNRIYEFSFSYENENAPINFKSGRIISNHISGVGYIDGLLIQQNISHSFRVGIFGGTQPEWQYSDFQTSLQKYGGYINYCKGDYRGLRYETTLAGAGVYHSNTISREFLYIQNTISNSSRWQIYQSSEIDINRQWRKDKAGEVLSLSNIFLSARYRFSRVISVGMSYDNRKNYWTYETRTLADSLFDDLLRRGVRGNVSLRLPYNINVFSTMGYRKREGDPEPTYSYSGGINKSNFFIERLFINLRGSGFSNPYSDGYSLNAMIGKYFLRANYLSIGFGNYFYNFSSTNLKRNNQWLRLEGQFQLISRFYFSSQYEYGLGEDVDGHRLFAEIGYRF